MNIYSNEKKYKEDLPGMPKESLDWGKCCMFDRASSRASAAGIRNLVYLGLEDNSNIDAKGWFDKFKKAIGEDKEKGASPEKIKLDFMAETEHLRWMAFELLQGYEKWNIDIPFPGSLDKPNKTTNFAVMQHWLNLTI